ncbi:protein of unknown function [Bartonella clarridgeiae 73]|uniref:Uncharacterized protein n=1 Tax=Bartonella clarridgeiae (strain CCUG 45776 / CIP 104772 / 73) TaxID=696125 RepID=E6YHC3_BARC7|nr:protein of unknown function [Bartonella clarridgeiae 73]
MSTLYLTDNHTITYEKWYLNKFKFPYCKQKDPKVKKNKSIFGSKHKSQRLFYSN